MVSMPVWFKNKCFPGKGRGHAGARLQRFFPEAEGINILRAEGSLKRTAKHPRSHSAQVQAGDVFYALASDNLKGLEDKAEAGIVVSYIKDALARGAAAVVVQSVQGAQGEVALNNFNALAKLCKNAGATCVAVNCVRSAHAIAQRIASGYPARGPENFTTYGVTGTNGKSTVTWLIQYLLNAQTEHAAHSPCGIVGTLKWEGAGPHAAESSHTATHTTPPVEKLYPLLKEMAAAGTRSVAMEFSSHGIAQKRMGGLALNVATFLNLSEDHLDYHGNLENYYQAKAALFKPGGPCTVHAAAVHVDDAHGARLAEELGELKANGAVAYNTFTFGTRPQADIRAERIELAPTGTLFELVTPSASLRVESPLLGGYNVSNVLAACASLHAAGLPLTQQLLAPLKTFPGVPGRMQRVSEPGHSFSVFIDYAHTAAALENVLGMLSGLFEGRLLVVFGCGGDRQRDKRAVMAATVSRWADAAWATSDNPRSEPIEQIFEDMRRGLKNAARGMAFEPSRQAAIRMAIEDAGAGDVVLIAGKGHETTQTFANETIQFDDAAVARELLGAA